MKPTLSILMAVKNGARFLTLTLDGLFEQVQSDYEVIAVDDGSTDRSSEILSSYPIRLQSLDGCQGLVHARNLALELAEGKYVAFLDQDDILVEGSFAKRVSFLESNPKCPCVLGEIASVVDAEGERLGDFYELSGKSRPNVRLTWENIKKGESLPGALWLYMFTRQYLQTLVPFDSEWGVLCDQDLLYRLLRCADIDFAPIPVAHYRIHESNSTVQWNQGSIGVSPQIKALGILLEMKHQIKV